jgi:hypothetical protein
MELTDYGLNGSNLIDSVTAIHQTVRSGQPLQVLDRPEIATICPPKKPINLTLYSLRPKIDGDR